MYFATPPVFDTKRVYFATSPNSKIERLYFTTPTIVSHKNHVSKQIQDSFPPVRTSIQTDIPGGRSRHEKELRLGADHTGYNERSGREIGSGSYRIQ